MKNWKNLVPPGTEEEIKSRRNAFLKKHSKEIAEKAESDIVGRAKKGLVKGLKFVDDSIVDKGVSRFKGLMRKIKKK